MRRLDARAARHFWTLAAEGLEDDGYFEAGDGPLIHVIVVSEADAAATQVPQHSVVEVWQDRDGMLHGEVLSWAFSG